MASLLKSLPLLRPVCGEVRQIRWKYHKVKPPKWADPKDLSWAEPLFERQAQKKKEAEAPEQEAAMLHMVFRVRPLNGRPYWEKHTMRCLGLHKQMNVPCIHKNIPTVNDMLKTVKHLIKIVPLRFPQGIPQNSDDFENCWIKDNGDVVIRKTVYPVDVAEDQQKAKDDLWTMQPSTWSKENVKKLQNYDLNREYFRPKYTYHYNEDGKEWRYFGNEDIGSKREWN